MTATETPVYRNGCGTSAGLIQHDEAAEALCPLCRNFEAYLALERELIPTRPTPPGVVRLTAEQVAANRRVIEELAAEDSTGPVQHLRPVPARREVA